ncbi:hypothetical protein D0Z07_2587 [Hyphodiscus hymeniophilus]|uniref:F-box domain-containing protein n=1 Tax=Hyphodiscus hymeniophilus TaxID=353542 RepID=A0A9P7AYR7_9HELO|nr:hypothetical protein D0Z07_2587 [Hyphodiscus hymeniophilus]
MAIDAVPRYQELAKKSSTEKMTTRSAAFASLPDEIIEQILLLTNPNAFASLIILNRKWRMVSQQAHLYAHHLPKCPSYSAAHHSAPIPEDDDSLPYLRRLFAREIKRNLFEAYLRPQETIINLVSTSISSASAPGGEAFHFSLSPRGHYVLAYSSSRIHVLDVMAPEVVVRRELKISRRPASTTITDDGLTLAVLSTDLQVDVYDLSGEHAKHTRVVSLDHAPRTIALSPDGSILAAAYDSGVEVSSLDADCISTDRRAVKCYAVDSLSFSRDGTQLLGSTTQSRNPSTVVLTAPYHNPGSTLPEESISALWTTSILFPNGSRDCSHAVLLPSPSDDEAIWAFTYDRVFETFRAVRIDDLRNGTTYFTGPTAEFGKLLPCSLPSASEAGDLVSAGFQGSIWLYGVPEDLDALPINVGVNSSAESEACTPSNQLDRRNSAPSLHPSARARDSRNVASLNDVSAMNWVSDNSVSFHRERLVAVAPGVGLPLENEEDGMNPTDGGRISILDFDYSTNDGRRRTITIEVGDKEPDVLEEEHRDIATEVALVRRRTVAQRQGGRAGLSRSATTAARPVRAEPPPMPPLPSITDVTDLFGLPPSGQRRSGQAIPTTDRSETASIDEEEAFDAPYSQTSPRSGTTLRRAATAAAVNRRLHPRAAAQGHIEYRRADGREEHPHESDADNWVPPPPPYTRDPIPPLPEHIQKSILAENAAATLQRSATQRAPSLDFHGPDGHGLHRSRTLASVTSNDSRRYSFTRARSDSTTLTIGAVSIEDDTPRPATSHVSGHFDELYDVSPPGSPQPTPSKASNTGPTPATFHQIPRRPVGANSNNNNAPDISPENPPRVLQATIEQPVSPVPQTQATHDTLDHRLRDWETTTEAGSDEVSNTSLPTTPRAPSTTLTRDRMEQDVPPRPTEDHHLSEIPPTTPVIIDRRQEIESQPTPPIRRAETEPPNRSSNQTMTEEPLPIWRRVGTAPTLSNQYQDDNTQSLVFPSADQIARLKSRKGRPPVQVLSDPSRRGSGGNPQSQNWPLPGSEPSRNSRGYVQNTPIRTTPDPFPRTTPPRAAVGAHGTLQNSYNNRFTQQPNNNNYSPQQQPQQQHQQAQSRPTPSQSRRVSLNPQSHNRQTSSSSSSPGLRQPLQRLDTIQSMNSNGGEPLPWTGQKQMTVGRQPSRAERSAAKNVKDAKKKGWRASMKKETKKEKFNDGASSTGWTDVSRESAMRHENRFGEREGKEKSGRCAVM